MPILIAVAALMIALEQISRNYFCYSYFYWTKCLLLFGVENTLFIMQLNENLSGKNENYVIVFGKVLLRKPKL